MSTSELLVRLGVLELTLGVISGWLMIVAGDPRLREKLGLSVPKRVRQGHIDLLMMGTILVALGAALPHPPTVPVLLIVVGSWAAPMLFFPLAFVPALGDLGWYRWLDRTGFLVLTLGYIALSTHVLTR